jgi:hypothetical protein
MDHLMTDYREFTDEDFYEKRKRVYRPLQEEVDPQVEEEIEEALKETKEIQEIKKSPWRN